MPTAIHRGAREGAAAATASACGMLCEDCSVAGCCVESGPVVSVEAGEVPDEEAGEEADDELGDTPV